MAASVTLQSAKDAEMREFNGVGNFGLEATMVSGCLGDNVGNEKRRAVFSFDLAAAAIPANATITSAFVELTVTKTPQPPASSVFGLRRLLRNWNQTAVSWNFAMFPGSPWELPGAAGAADSITASSSSVLVSGTGKYVFASTTELIADVRAWLDNPSSNFGWLLQSDDENTPRTARHFGTRESGANAPTLTIEYTISEPVTPPQIQNVDVASGSIRVRLTGDPDFTYVLEGRDSLIEGNWTDRDSAIVKLAPREVTLTDATGTHGFYRIRKQPCNCD
jgi:hypothetical protein